MMEDLTKSEIACLQEIAARSGPNGLGYRKKPATCEKLAEKGLAHTKWSAFQGSRYFITRFGREALEKINAD